MDIIHAILGCRAPRTKSRAASSANEKTDAFYQHSKERTTQDIARDVIATLNHAEKSGDILKLSVKDTVGEYGWTESLAEAILKGLENLLRSGAALGKALKEAAEKAANAALGFAHDHPVFCTIVALGILVELAPWVIEVLGFGELGPLEGTFAAWWQARYAGYVPKGSLWSYLQRLGMTWKKASGKLIE